jgi:hypothetical protein
MIIGLDLVNEEDAGNPLEDYADYFNSDKTRESGLNYFFHCGESLRLDNTSVLDAYLLGADRVGHGFNLYRFPDIMELYKDDVLVDVLNVREVNDTTLASLPYGDYKARLFKGSTYSDFTYWKVINVDVSIDKANNTVYFQSQNSIPESYEFCTISGSRGIPQTYVHELTDEEVRNGFSVIPSNKINSSATYIKVHFKCDYGRVINQPIVWK